ncbi:MAG: hypothetical protein WDW38_010823 [Sanguina aurantia]
MSCPPQVGAEDRLLQLPTEVLHHILGKACNSTDHADSNPSHLALRLSSKGLAAASDAARTSLTLHPSHLHDASSLLSKLTALTAVTVRSSGEDAPTTTNLGPIRSHAPHLTSLTVCGCEAYLAILDLDQVLLQWKHSLTQLKLFGCVLMTDASDGAGPPQQSPWSPDLPCLTLLTIHRGTSTGLDLCGCPALQELELSECHWLTSIGGLPGLEALHRARLLSLPQLADVDIAGCSKLVSFSFNRNGVIGSLDLGGCPALKDVQGCDFIQAVQAAAPQTIEPAL